MLKSEGHLEEAMNVQESLRHKVNEPDLIKNVIKLLSEMNEKSKAEKSKHALEKVLDTRKSSTENVTDAVTKFRNNVSEWEAISKVPLDGLLKSNLLMRMLHINEQVEGNIRTKVDFNAENSEELYNSVERAVKDLANSIQTTAGTYHYDGWNDKKQGKKYFSRERSQSKDRQRG